MKIPFIDSYIRSGAYTEIRNGMRGYRLLKESGRMEFVFKLKEDITNTALSGFIPKGSSLFFGAAAADVEIVARQFLASRVLSYNFNKKVLAALGNGTNRITHPLPPEWRMVIEKNGLIANTRRNKIFWVCYQILYWLFGYKVILQNIYEGCKELFRKADPDSVTNYAYFDSVTAKNLPQTGAVVSYDIFNWYNQWPNRTGNIDSFCHDIKNARPAFVNDIPVVGIPSAIPRLKSGGKIFLFIGWSIRASFLVLIRFCQSDYRYAILLGEAAKSAKLRLANPKMLARDYLFHNANWIYRPLWTYDAESAGSRILFYFYSTNVEGFKISGTKLKQANSWQLISWPEYLVWDNWQADFIRKASKGRAIIEVVGSVWFISGNNISINTGERLVTVFDINPLRDARYYAFAEPVEYLVPEVINRFLQDIHSLADEKGMTMFLKRKRDIGNLLHYKYKKLLDALTISDHFTIIDMDISVIQLIEASCMVISLPFTSTALISRELGKPACYYDPTGMVLKDDPAAHGITIVSGPAELKKWMDEVLT